MVLRLLTTLRLGVGPLDRLGQRVVVLDEQRGREAARAVERVRDVEQHLPGQVLGAGGLEDPERDVAAGGVHHQLGARGGVGEGGEAYVGVLRGPAGVVVARSGAPRVAGAESDRVTQPCGAAGHRAAHGSGAEDGDLEVVHDR
jgi:hypothetical protein